MSQGCLIYDPSATYFPFFFSFQTSPTQIPKSNFELKIFFRNFKVRNLILRNIIVRISLFAMNAVVELRQRLGISQEEASLLLGISRGHLSKIEIGQSPPKGLSEVYLFQAIRLLDQMEEPPYPEIVSSEPPEFVRKERERLTLRKLKLDQQKATLSIKIKQVLCLKPLSPCCRTRQT
jgi:transcriptional regulator with XRE-family HTH domain